MAKKIYCAGPLFNAKEKEEMQEIADALEKSGYDVFLPHRDGFEFANLTKKFEELGISDSDSKQILNHAIFTLDVFQVLVSDGLVLNINGRVPDEGAMVEAGIAWNAGKEIVIYKNDARTLIDGNDNPLLLGLSNFKVLNNICEIPDVFNILLVGTPIKETIDSSRIESLYKKGEQIFRLSSNLNNTNICQDLIDILELDYAK